MNKFMLYQINMLFRINKNIIYVLLTFLYSGSYANMEEN